MKIRTLRARVTLWSVAVVIAALLLFGAGAAWNLRKELRENLDDEITTEAHDFFTGVRQQGVDWRDPRSVEALFDQSKRFHYVEIHDTAGRLLYRSPNLKDQTVFPSSTAKRLHELTWNGRTLRFGVFEEDGIILALGKDTEDTGETLWQLITAYLLALPLVVIVVGVGSWWIAHRAVAPIKAIAAKAENITASDLHQRLPDPSSRDEIGDLTRVLNGMFDRLERSFEQIIRFTSDASHELKTPLALIRAEVETALASPQFPAAQRELLSSVIEQCSKLTQIVDGLLFLSRADDRRLAIAQEPVDLSVLIRELLEDAEILAEPFALKCECEMPTSLLVQGDARLLARALMNLLDNAIKYNRASGRVIVSGAVSGANVVVNICNTGACIEAAAQANIFDRFFRGDLSHNNATNGHGLGLSIAREIARAHGGEITLVRSDSDSTEFALLLPMSAALRFEAV